MNSAFMDGVVEDQQFLDADIEILKRCDVVVAMSNYLDSIGARAEIEIAILSGIEVIYESSN